MKPKAVEANTLSPIVGALPENITLVRPEQYLKAQSPMLVTLAGRMTLVRPSQL